MLCDGFGKSFAKVFGKDWYMVSESFSKVFWKGSAKGFWKRFRENFVRFSHKVFEGSFSKIGVIHWVTEGNAPKP